MTEQTTDHASADHASNRLIHETSPYLLQHAYNPVDWYAWGEEALARAQAENKPIFLSVGYSACHWCHVMERESFEQPQVARVMNELFINIKVDREERPDLDAIYMEAVQAMTGQGGWPMSVFLTPDGRPFYGGTYYPPEPRYGMPSFLQVLHAVDEAYRNRQDQVLGQAERLTEALRRTALLEAGDQELGSEILDEAMTNLLEYFDEDHGGFGDQPKFPQPPTLDFAMTQYARAEAANPGAVRRDSEDNAGGFDSLDALHMAELTLEQMALGGIYDQLGGGFHRYSVDAVWLVPHFEKMLYDNAQLLNTYLRAWLITERPLYRRVLDETIDYVLREMTAPQGGFYSTQDADSEGEEGKFFVWTPQEIAEVLEPRSAGIFEMVYGVSARGNFEGSNILHMSRTLEDVAARFDLEVETVAQLLQEARAKLFAAREQRIKPARDEKILTEWNGLMIHALAECGARLERSDALDAARAAANFVLGEMSQPDGKLYRSYKDGRARFNGYLEDYAALIRGLIALYEATFELRWLGEASRLAGLMFSQFHDKERGGFFQTGVDHESLVVRRKDYIDNAVPSGNSLAAEVLVRLAALVGNTEYRHEALRIVLTMKAAMAQQPTGFGHLLSTADGLLQPSREIAIVGDPADANTQALLQEVRGRYLPHAVIALKQPNEESVLPLLEGRGLHNDLPAAYVCENYSCRLPVNAPEDLAQLLDG